MDLPKVNSDGWRLSKRGQMSDRIPDSAYAKVGLPVTPTKTSSGGDAERVGTVIDMTEWTLPKDEAKPMRVNVVAKRSTKKPAKAKGGSSEQPMLYGGMARKAVLPEELKHELRRLAGLERSAHIEFATGTPHRRMPEGELYTGIVPEMPIAVAESVESDYRLSEDQRNLAGLGKRNPLPRPGGFVPPAARSAGILDPVTESEGEAYVQKILQESNWFFRDFNGLSLGAVGSLGEAPGGRRGPWRGSEDELPDDEPEDGEEPEDEEPPKQQRKRQGFGAQAKPAEPEDEEPDEEPEDEEPEDDEETESIDEAGDGGPSLASRVVQHLGGKIQGLGHGVTRGGQSLGNVHQKMKDLARKHADKVASAKKAREKQPKTGGKPKPAMPGAAKPVATAK